MNYPQNVHDTIDAVVKEFPDLEAAIATAVQRVRALENFNDLLQEMVFDAVRSLVYASRHKVNVAIKRDCGHFTAPSRVTAAGRAAVERVYETVYNYKIGGKEIGMLTRDELLAVGEAEGAKEAGHRFNRLLVTELAKRVKDGKTVRECVKEAALQDLFTRTEAAAREAA